MRSRHVRHLAAALVAAAACATPTQHAGAQFQPTPPATDAPMLVVSGTGEIRVTPDLAHISLGVETRRSSAAQASTENARTTRAVLDAIRATGIPAADVTTTDFSVTPDQQYDQQTRAMKVVGYIVRNTVRVRVAKLEQTGPVLDAALGKGANTVQSVDLTVSGMPAVRRQALAAAVEQARADAQAMAAAAGGSLGPLVEIVSQDVSVPVFEKAVMMRGVAMAADAAPTPIAAGDQLVTARVSTRWKFIPSR